MVVYRERGLDVMRPLGSEGSGYSSPLLEKGAESANRVRTLLAFAATKADLFFLPFVRNDGELSKVTSAIGLLRAVEHAGPAPFIRWSEFENWNAYQRSRSSFLRNKMRRMRNRLERHGVVVLGEEDRRNAKQVIAWIIRQKERMLLRDQVTDAWLTHSDYSDFWAALAAKEEAVKILTIRLDGVLVAAQVCAVDGQRLEGFLSAFDNQWAHCSPGHLLIEYAIRWAFERGLDLDTRMGDERYKRDWTSHGCDTFTWHIAASWRAAPWVLARSSHLWKVRARTRLSQWRHWLKAHWRGLQTRS
jgi:CelD/BcsL family acetyltransferase involved in cellulose biosynthesis